MTYIALFDYNIYKKCLKQLSDKFETNIFPLMQSQSKFSFGILKQYMHKLKHRASLYNKTEVSI